MKNKIIKACIVVLACGGASTAMAGQASAVRSDIVDCATWSQVWINTPSSSTCVDGEGSTPVDVAGVTSISAGKWLVKANLECPSGLRQETVQPSKKLELNPACKVNRVFLSTAYAALRAMPTDKVDCGTRSDTWVTTSANVPTCYRGEGSTPVDIDDVKEISAGNWEVRAQLKCSNGRITKNVERWGVLTLSPTCTVIRIFLTTPKDVTG